MVHCQKTHWFNLIPTEILYKPEIVVKRKCLWSTSEDQKHVQSPRKKDKDTYEVRVERRSEEGLVSFSK